ncbi:MAG: malate synthase [Sulfobacillus sp.]
MIEIFPCNDSHTDLVREVLSPGCQEFLLALHHNFDERLANLLERRSVRPELQIIRISPDFRVRPPPEILRDRRVEITGPADNAKLVINALNSGAKVFMADLEDSMSPTWDNILRAHDNLNAAVRGSLTFVPPQGTAEPSSDKSRAYAIGRDPALLMVRPRGLHLREKHVMVSEVPGKTPAPVSATLFDLGVFLWNNGKYLSEKSRGPWIYVPKLEHQLEARFWNDVCVFCEGYLKLPSGEIRLTVLVETFPGCLQMDAILYELRDRVLGLNCGRWDYLFSFLKYFPEKASPDRSALIMSAPFLRAWSRLVSGTCRLRGAQSIGGMSAALPRRNDPEANRQAREKVLADKLQEAADGHQGTWVAHPDFVALGYSAFGQSPCGAMPESPLPGIEDILAMPEGGPSSDGLRQNIGVALRYLSAWIAGVGAVAIDGSMEDTATAEIARMQIWQWLRLQIVAPELCEQLIASERDRAVTDGFAKADEAARFLRELIFAEKPPEFFTLAYDASKETMELCVGKT